MKTAARIFLSSSLAAAVVTAPAQLAEGPPESSLLHAMAFDLWRLAAVPAALAAPEQAELKLLAVQSRAALATLQASGVDERMPADYEQSLMTAALVVGRTLAKSTVTRDDLPHLRLVARDLQAKRRWAERNPRAPFGPVKVEAVVVGAQTAARSEIYFRALLDDALDAAAPGFVSRAARRVLVRPGCYVFWLRLRETPLAAGERVEFHADGSTQRLELVAR